MCSARLTRISHRNLSNLLLAHVSPYRRDREHQYGSSQADNDAVEVCGLLDGGPFEVAEGRLEEAWGGGYAGHCVCRCVMETVCGLFGLRTRRVYLVVCDIKACLRNWRRNRSLVDVDVVKSRSPSSATQSALFDSPAPTTAWRIRCSLPKLSRATN